MLRLSDDIVSFGKDKRIYGKKNDEVKIISDCGNVLILEGPDGERFPAPKDKVIEDNAAPGSAAAKNKINWLPKADNPAATVTTKTSANGKIKDSRKAAKRTGHSGK